MRTSTAKAMYIRADMVRKKEILHAITQAGKFTSLGLRGKAPVSVSRVHSRTVMGRSSNVMANMVVFSVAPTSLAV